MPSPSSLTSSRPELAAPSPDPGKTGSGRYAAAALARATMAVATAQVNSRHDTAVREAWGLARLVAAGLLTGSDVSRAIDGALQRAGKPEGEGAAIAAWAVARRGGGNGVAR